MFTSWIKDNDITSFEYNFNLFPKIEDREFWDKRKNDYVKNRGNDFLNYNWPIIRASSFMEFSKSGNRVIMENVYWERRGALVALVVSALMTNDDKYIPQIVDGIFSICEETYWGVSAHWPTSGVANIPDSKNPTIDLFAAETGATLSEIHYMLNSKLKAYCPEILTRIEYEVNRRIIVPYLEHVDYWWQGYYRNVNNWNPWIISNVLVSSLIMVKDKIIFKRLFDKMMTEIDFYYKGLPDDGGCNEGIVYYTRAGASLCEFIYILKNATNGKINFFNDEKIKKIASFPVKMYIGDGFFVNFADGSPYGCRSEYYLIYMIGKEIGDKNMIELSRELYDIRNVKSVNKDIRRIIYPLMVDEEIENLEKTPLEDKCYVLPDTQVLTKRLGKWFLGIKGGHNDECHNHNDVGSFVLSYDNDLIAIDCGVGTYTKQTFSEERYKIWTMRSLYHNLPEINGCEEAAGKKYKCDSFVVNENELYLSLKNAYYENSGLKKYIRKAKLTEDGLIINDVFNFQSEDKSEVIEHIMTRYKPYLKDNVVYFGNYYIMCDKFDFSFDTIDTTSDNSIFNTWKQNELYRINLKTQNVSNITYTIERNI